MASHVHADGWNLDADQVEEDTGYLHMVGYPANTRTLKEGKHVLT
jgi:hypothetical protein